MRQYEIDLLQHTVEILKFKNGRDFERTKIFLTQKLNWKHRKPKSSNTDSVNPCAETLKSVISNRFVWNLRLCEWLWWMCGAYSNTPNPHTLYHTRLMMMKLIKEKRKCVARDAAGWVCVWDHNNMNAPFFKKIHMCILTPRSPRLTNTWIVGKDRIRTIRINLKGAICRQDFFHA